MRKAFSILVLAWVFIIAPGICLGAIGGHHCECAEMNCPDCSTTPDENSHGCHDDPCPKDVCRTEQDESIQADVADDCNLNSVATPGSAAVLSSIIDAHTSILWDTSPPVVLRGADLFAFAGLPLLI